MLKKILLVLIVMIFSTSVFSEKELLDSREVADIYKMQYEGRKAYKKEDYETAFVHLTKAAELGMKNSQYLLGLMYLKGQAVKKSNLTGMAWLGVAKESGVKEVVSMHDKLYAAFNEKQREFIDEKTAEFVALYGLEAQGVSCLREKRVSSKRFKVNCYKNSIDIQRFTL